MRPDDLDAVMAIERVSFPEPWPRQFFEQEIANSPPTRALVATLDGALIGYMVSWDMVGDIHLGNLAVDERHRRLGIAQALLDVLLAGALRDGSLSVTLEVRASNRAAIALYARNRFRPAGLRKGYYRGREDAIVMVHDLEGR